MNVRLLKSVGAMALPAAAAVLLAQACVSSNSAQSDESSDPIEGLWNSQVTITNCQTGAPMRQFRAMNLFNRGGTLVDTDTQPPAAHGPAYGTWQSSGSSRYTSVMQLFRFNADGSFAGANKVTRTITLTSDGNGFSSTLDVAVQDPTGAVLSSACGSETATRVR